MQIPNKPCMSRRQFLLTSGSTVAVLALSSLSSFAWAETDEPKMKLAKYPKTKIGTISGLETGKPQKLHYPYPEVPCMLVKLGEPAGAGIGPEKDIVCYTTTCTHMGAPLEGTYKPKHQILGACPLHLTTFDLTRHGLVVSGHATESLPQILLEAKGDDIYAVGVMGLIYGFNSNLEKSKN